MIQKSTHDELLKQIHVLENELNEYKKAQTSLTSREERYKTLYEFFPDDVFIIDRDYRFVATNRSSWNPARFTKNQIIGKKITDIFPQISDYPFWSACTEAMEKRVTTTALSELTYETDVPRWYNAQYFPIPEGILVLSRDVTDQKTAENRLKKSEAILEVPSFAVTAVSVPVGALYTE